MRNHLVVAGAGIWGCTVARRLAEAGRHVVVLEKRPFVGGNCACEIDLETGIEIHLYGSHIFHTHNVRVWDFMNRFTSFNSYQHKVLARYGGKTFFLPLGLALINKFFGVDLTPGQVPTFMADKQRSAALFDAFFRGYTAKQWGRPAESLAPSVLKRIPVRSNYDINYFNDVWQGIPTEGYTRLFERMLDHPNIEVRTSALYELNDEETVFYSGPIDALFDYKFGALPWRTLRFELETLPVADFQGTSVVNYPELTVPYTRIHEFKHYHPEGRLNGTWGADAKKTIVAKEYPDEWKRGDEPYYPIADVASSELASRYQAEACLYPGLIVGGRLGLYRYLDMDQAVHAALEAVDLFLEGSR